MTECPHGDPRPRRCALCRAERRRPRLARRDLAALDVSALAAWDESNLPHLDVAALAANDDTHDDDDEEPTP